MSENVVPLENPFSVQRVRPGAIPFVFDDATDADQFVEKLRRQNWTGQIVGPHGSGKSTLLATLEPCLQQAGRVVHKLALRDGARHLPKNWLQEETWTTTSLIIIDGYEQLGWIARMHLRWHCWQHGIGLLITSHQPIVGIALLATTHTTPELAERICMHLMQDQPTPMPTADLLNSYQRNMGNLRDVWFDLYDLHGKYERGRRSTSTAGRINH